MPKVHDQAPRKERYLEDYRVHYVNKDFPLLSLIYAVMAGGETPLYCDHTDKFVKAYILDHYPNGLPPHVAKFMDLLGQFDKATQERKKFVSATEDDWKVILECVRAELVAGPVPATAW